MSYKLISFPSEKRINTNFQRRASLCAFDKTIFRSSLDNRQQRDMWLRSSDIGHVPNLSQGLNKVKSTVQFNYVKQKQSKNTAQLLQTLQGLSQKLDFAKKQLNIKKQNIMTSFSITLNEVNQSLEKDEKSFYREIIDKMEQSTLSFQSRKKLTHFKDEKEQQLWANNLKTYYISEIVRGITGTNDRALQHLNLSREILCKFKEITTVQQNPKSTKTINLPLSSENANKKILIMDLDETLIHCQSARMSPQDLEVDIPTGKTFEKAYIALRPYTISFLKKAKRNFEIILFTASQKSYADAIIDQIDPQNKLFDHRLYRNNCVKILNKIYSKDLSLINRDLSKTVLVDNSPFSYLHQISNAIPILSYTGGLDSQLLHLQKYLEQIRKQEDVRCLNLRTFKLHKYREYEDSQILVDELYCDKPQFFDLF